MAHCRLVQAIGAASSVAPSANFGSDVEAGGGDVLLEPRVVGRVLVDDAGEVVHRHRELCRRRAQELHQHDDHEDAGAGEHEVLQPHVVLEARHQQDRHERGADDADGHDAGVALRTRRRR